MSTAPPRFGVIADDLTGANAVAAMAASRGIPVWTALGPHPAGAPPAEPLLVALDAATRDGWQREAAGSVARAVGWLRRAGIERIAKRIDTTLRGHIGVEVEALLAALGAKHLAVVVPALPAAGRTARGGRVYLRDRPLAEVAGLADDAAAALRAGTALDVAHLPLPAVRAARESMAVTVRRAFEQRRVLLCDAETDADIDAIAAAVRAAGVLVLPVDPGPFTLAVAGSGLMQPGAALIRPAFPDAGPDLARRTGVLAVFGSAEPAALRQVERAVRAGAVQVIDVPAATVAAGQTEAIAGRITALLQSGQGPAVGVRIDPTSGPLSDRGAVSRFLAAATGATLLGCRPSALYLSGGAVARVALDVLGADGLRIVAQVQPLAAGGYITGGPFAGLPVVTKGGLAGDEDAVIACLRALRRGVQAADYV